MTRLAKDILITMFGGLTCLATAVVLVLVSVLFDFSFHSLIWWIVPIGAIVSGFVASTGYRWGAKRLNHRPGPFLLLSIVGLSICTPLMVNYVHYSRASIQGIPLHERVGFLSYLKYVNSHSAITFRDEDWEKVRTFEIGMWGYGLAILQVAGFAFGGLLSYKNLRRLPWCVNCHKYLRATTEGARFCKHEQDLRTFLDDWVIVLAVGDVSGALTRFHAYGSAKPQLVAYRVGSEKAPVRMELSNWRCPGCDYSALELTLAKWNGEEWNYSERIRLVGRQGNPFEVQSSAA